MSRLLIDTHVALWWLSAPDRLTPAVKRALGDPDTEVLFSSISSAEIAVKHAIGRLVLPQPLTELIASLFRDDGFTALAFEHAHAMALATLPLHHRDPFDRMLIAQATVERIPLVTADAAISRYDVDVLW